MEDICPIHKTTCCYFFSIGTYEDRSSDNAKAVHASGGYRKSGVFFAEFTLRGKAAPVSHCGPDLLFRFAY